jgi:hypothetical protein
MATEIIRISPESFQTFFVTKENGEILLSADGKRVMVRQVIPSGITPVRIYDYEKQQNENRREIVLIDRTYRNQVVDEFKGSLRS